MIQTGIVVSIKDGVAEISVKRETACGENCASCSAKCSLKNVTVRGQSIDGINTGDMVMFEMAASKILFAAFLVYITPLIVMVFAYLIASTFGVDENISFVISVICMVLWFLVVHFIDKKLRHLYKHTILNKIEGDM